jgi:radical SAM superfamily enzyme
MHKQYGLGEARRASDLLRHHGIRRTGFLLLGGPGETRGSVEESLEFAEGLDLDALKLSIGIRIYPNTDVARIAQEEGLIGSIQDLLFPRFYLAKGLEDWLYDTVTRRLSANPRWLL